ncbi:MAG: hypothetical protein FWB91_03195 [Defluviitaleaceae bacterium]|nr:hypothetical protein [Defluviitaleaceae bacterium]
MATTFMAYQDQNPEGNERVSFDSFVEKFRYGKLDKHELEFGLDMYKENFDANMDFNQIYIDGQSVADTCAYKLKGITNDNERNQHMKCYVVASALERNARIEVVTPDEKGRPQISPVHTETDEPAPKKSFFRRWGEKLGLMKPKLSEQEKYEKDYVNYDPQRESRQQTILQDLQEKSDAKKNLQPQKDKIIKENVAYSKVISDGIEHDRKELCDALFGPFSNGGSGADLNMKVGGHVRYPRSGVSIGIAYLFNAGHSFEDILNPAKLKDEKATVGNMIINLAKEDASGDEFRVGLARAEMSKLHKNFAMNYEQLPVQNIDYSNLKDVSENYREIHCRGMVACDMWQEFTRVKDEMKKDIGDKEVERLQTGLGIAGHLYTVPLKGASLFEISEKTLDDKSSTKTLEELVVDGMTYLHGRKGADKAFSKANLVKDLFNPEADKMAENAYMQKTEANRILGASGKTYEKKLAQMTEAVMLGVEILDYNGETYETKPQFYKLDNPFDAPGKSDTSQKVNADTWETGPSKQPKEIKNSSVVQKSINEPSIKKRK